MQDDDIWVLYRLIWGHPSINADVPVVPRVPSNRMECEDDTVARICTAPTLDDCLTGIGPSNVGLNYLKGLIDDNDDNIEALNLGNALFPFTVMRFEFNKQDPNVWLPGKVAKFVPDAFHSQECWITASVVPQNVKKLWLVDGKIVPHSLLFKGEKRRYFLLTDTKWSDKEQAANADFVQNIMDITKTLLVQSYDFPDVMGKTSLNEQIDAAEQKKVSVATNNGRKNRNKDERALL